MTKAELIKYLEEMLPDNELFTARITNRIDHEGYFFNCVIDNAPKFNLEAWRKPPLDLPLSTPLLDWVDGASD